jgi:hypothetical protein
MQKYIHTVGTILKSSSKAVERGKICTTNTHTHGLPMFCLGTCTISGWVRLDLSAETCPFSEIMLKMRTYVITVVLTLKLWNNNDKKHVFLLFWSGDYANK